MCGIVGYVARSARAGIARAELPAAMRSIAHRGPDGSDCWFDHGHGVGLGHVRLAILDTSEAGNQPMVSQDGRWVMVFNGEVYNFSEIRRELEAKGKRFKSSGDSEVVLEALSEWGIAALDRFAGMFAIALWDRQHEELHLIRDRVGVKPLYYANMNGSVVFASELKALRCFSFFNTAIDASAIGEYLRYGYLSEQTAIFTGTQKVSPGCWVRIDRDGVQTELRYWSVQSKSKSETNQFRSDAQWEAHIESLLVQSAKLRMVSDVPVGVFLSGGIDSSLVTALLQKTSAQQLKTFTIGFDSPEFNEAQHAKNVALHLGTDHHEYIMPASAALELLPTWGDLYDEPFGDSSGLPTLLVSKAAAMSVKVVLSADGGDELFSGYGRYTIAQERGERLEAMPRWFRTFAAKALDKLPLYQWDSWIADNAALGKGRHAFRHKTTWRARKISERIGLANSAQFYDSAQAHFSNEEIWSLTGVNPHIRPSSGVYSGPPVEQFAQWDFDHYLPGDILTKVDRATMRSGIEGREPLLDHRLIEAAFNLPMHLKRGPLGPKHILKKILYRYVPQGLVDRPKRGFAVPMEQWLRGPLKPLLRDTLASACLPSGGVFESKKIGLLLSRFESGDQTLTTPIWLLLAFELWRQRWASH